MARKKAPEEHENHERWLVSYADFITLLFAFFVVMYAISSVNEGKYRVLSDSLVAAFRSSPKSLQPIQIGGISKAPVTSTEQVNQRKAAIVKLPKMFLSQEISKQGIMRDPLLEEKYKQGDNLVELQKIADNVRKALAKLVAQGLITVKQKALWVEVLISDSVLFPSGSARLQSKAVGVIKKLAGILQDFPNPVRVEGFTDNVPIKTIVYPSNWELSAARAASVVRLFSASGIAPDRLVAQGYGEFRPVASNETSKGRARNRRVVVVVLADQMVEKLLSDRASLGLKEIKKPAGKSTVVGASTMATGQALQNKETLSVAMKPTQRHETESAQPGTPPAALQSVGQRKSVIMPATRDRINSLEQVRHAPLYSLPVAPSRGLLTPDLAIEKPLVIAPQFMPPPINLHNAISKKKPVVTKPGTEAVGKTENQGPTVSNITHYE